jgi:hypothetical protein
MVDFKYLGEMIYRKHIATFLFMGIITCCLGQSNEYKVIIPPKVELKLNSLYPYAANIAWSKRLPTDNTQTVDFDCKCPEGLGHLTITFDTNGTILNENILISKQDLPAAIITYIENNYPNEFEYGNIFKLNATGDISYRVDMKQTVPDGNATSGWIYVLKFKGSGEFISVEKRQ